MTDQQNAALERGTPLDKQSPLGYSPDMDLTREHFREWGRKGGTAKNERKSRASRANGKRGGRPKKTKTKA